jgi:hypothetical protein
MDVHTVIITDKRTTQLFDSDKYRHMFAPFLVERGGNICQCSWNEGGDGIEQAVPELYKAIKGHPTWRAIIFTHPKQTDLLPFNPLNPFEFDCNQNDEILFSRNTSSLVELTHMLAGFPPLGVKDYTTKFVYYNKLENRVLDCTHDDGRVILQSDIDKYDENRQKEIFAKFEDMGGNIKSQMIEIEYKTEEKLKHKQLTKEYAFKENRPIEVLIVSTREIIQDDDRETTRDEVRRTWEFHVEEESSDFWKAYPNTCRFLCYDLINTEHTLYSRELWRLCLLVLTIAVNQIPGQVLQAYRLYKADLSINASELAHMLAEYIENLLAVQSVIQERMTQTPELTKNKKGELVPLQDISVKFEQTTEGSVMANPKKLGLASNCPMPEKKFWREYMNKAKQMIDDILSAPQEIVVDKAIQTRRKAYDFSGRTQVLDRFQIDRINKRIDELEAQVINAKVYGVLDTETHKNDVEEAGKEVRKFLGLRLTKRNIFLISAFSLLVYICGFIPYLVNSARISWGTFGAAVGLMAIALVLLAGGGLLVLWFLRRRLVKKVKEYNKKVRAVFDRVNKGAVVYSDYFSSVCTYMYAKSLLTGVILQHNSDFTEGRIQKGHLASLEKEIKRSRELCQLYEVKLKEPSVIDAAIDIADSFLLEMPSASQIYELRPNDDTNTLELDRTGQKLNAPYSFIMGISLIREELYK